MPKSEAYQPMAAIGEYETVLPFQAVGVRPFIVDEESLSGFPELLLNLTKQNYAVIFIQEKLFIEFSTHVNEINEKYSVSVIPIPGLKGSMGTGLESIKTSVERAVGMDIFSVN